MNEIKRNLLIGSFAYFILAILAIIFYKERVIFSDAVCHFFLVLKNEGYFNPIHRYGVYIVQTPLLLGSKLSLSHATLAIIYSLTFVAYQALIFFLSYFISKDFRIPFIWLLFNILIVTDTFYWMISELPLGVGIAMLFFSFWVRKKEEKLFEQSNMTAYVGLAGISILAVFAMQFFHPLMLVIFFILASFFLLSGKNKQEIGIITLLMLAFYYAGKGATWALGQSGYDEESMKNFENITKLYPHYWDLGSNWHFLSYIKTDYYFLPILLLLLSIFYLKSKKWLKLAWTIGGFFTYLFIVNVSYHHTQMFEQYYMENLYLPLSLILILGLVWDFLPSLSPIYSRYILIGIVCIRLIHIFLSHDIFTERLNLERQVLQQTENSSNKKLLIPSQDIPIDKYIVTWATPFEFWLLSAIESKELRSVLIEDNFSKNIADYDSLMSQNKVFFMPFGKKIDYKAFPKTYFNFQDTSQYVIYKPDLNK